MICDEFMGGYDFEAHLAHLRTLYRHKARLMLSLIDQHLVPAGVTYDTVQGGLFVWCRLPDGADMPRFCQEAVKEHKVAVVPGNTFLTDENEPCQAFRLNYSTPPMKKWPWGWSVWAGSPPLIAADRLTNGLPRPTIRALKKPTIGSKYHRRRRPQRAAEELEPRRRRPMGMDPGGQT